MKYFFVFIIFTSVAFAQTKSEKLASLLVEKTNQANASLSSVNNGVKVYKSEARGSMVINHREELTKSKNDLMVIKDKYIRAYQDLSCTFLKPLINEGVVIKNNIYAMDGGLAFSFIVRCD